MPTDGVPAYYISYLLRVWRTQERGRPTWRALLENIVTGKRKGFNDLSGLIAFLEAGTPESNETPAESQDFCGRIVP